MRNRESSDVPIRYDSTYSQSEEMGDEVNETPTQEDYSSNDYDLPGSNYNGQEESDNYEEGTKFCLYYLYSFL